MLAGAFAWAAVAKLSDRATTVRGFTELRLPAARALSLLVPLVEATVAIALVAVPRAGAVGALVTLACFTGVLVARLQDGPPVRCGCFGSRSDEDISFVEPLRNGLLALLAMARHDPHRPGDAGPRRRRRRQRGGHDRSRRPRRRPARARRAYQPSAPGPRHAVSGSGWIASYVALWVAVLVLAVACLVLLRRARRWRPCSEVTAPPMRLDLV